MDYEEKKFYDPEYDRKDGYKLSIASTAVSGVGLIAGLVSLLNTFAGVWQIPFSGVFLGIAGVIISKISDKGCGLKHKLFVKLGKLMGVASLLLGFMFTFLSLGQKI